MKEERENRSASKAKIKDDTSTFIAVTSRFLSCTYKREVTSHARTVLYDTRPSIKMSRRTDSPEGTFANAIKRKRARVANNYRRIWLNFPLWLCQIGNRYNDITLKRKASFRELGFDIVLQDIAAVIVVLKCWLYVNELLSRKQSIWRSNVFHVSRKKSILNN